MVMPHLLQPLWQPGRLARSGRLNRAVLGQWAVHNHCSEGLCELRPAVSCMSLRNGASINGGLFGPRAQRAQLGAVRALFIVRHAPPLLAAAGKAAGPGS